MTSIIKDCSYIFQAMTARYYEFLGANLSVPTPPSFHHATLIQAQNQQKDGYRKKKQRIHPCVLSPFGNYAKAASVHSWQNCHTSELPHEP